MSLSNEIPAVWARCRAKSYDLVLNGTELGSGSIRIHRRDIQAKVFEAVGFSDDGRNPSATKSTTLRVRPRASAEPPMATPATRVAVAIANKRIPARCFIARDDTAPVTGHTPRTGGAAQRATPP